MIHFQVIQYSIFNQIKYSFGSVTKPHNYTLLQNRVEYRNLMQPVTKPRMLFPFDDYPKARTKIGQNHG